MNKLIAFLLALVMLFSVATVFAGCEDSSNKKTSSSKKHDDDDEDEDDEENDEAGEEGGDELTEDEADDENGNSEPEGGNDTSEVEDEEQETTAPTEPEWNESAEEMELSYFLGNVNGNVYESEFIGFGCELPDDWYLYDMDTVLALNGVDAESDQEAMELLKEYSVIYSFYAISDGGSGANNMNITLEATDPDLLAKTDLTENLNKIAPSLEETMLSIGCAYYNYEILTAEIDREEIPCLVAETELYGTAMYQFMTMLKCDGYVCCITITALDYDTLGELLEGFYLI